MVGGTPNGGRHQMPEGRDVAAVFIGWAQKHHWHWFHGRRKRATIRFGQPTGFLPMMPTRFLRSSADWALHTYVTIFAAGQR
jgi:hypothetical protein